MCAHRSCLVFPKWDYTFCSAACSFSTSFLNIFPFPKGKCSRLMLSQERDLVASGGTQADVQLLVAVVALPVPSAVNGRLAQGRPGSAARGSVPSTRSLSRPFSLLTQQEALFQKDGLSDSESSKSQPSSWQSGMPNLTQSWHTASERCLVSNLRSFSRNARGGIRPHWLPVSPSGPRAGGAGRPGLGEGLGTGSSLWSPRLPAHPGTEGPGRLCRGGPRARRPQGSWHRAGAAE